MCCGNCLFFRKKMNALALLYVGFGGAFGSIARYALVNLIARFNATPFPYGTVAVNVFGSLLIGIWIASITVMPSARAKDLHLLFAVGVLGGFTTFSGFSLDVFLLGERELYLQMALYIILSVMLSLAALLLGMWLVKLAAA